MKNIEFIPASATTAWDYLEFMPVYEDENGVCEVVDEGEESFWSVYLHQISGGVVCIADLPSKELAALFAETLENATKSRKI